MAVDTPFMGDSIGDAPLNSAVLDGIVTAGHVADCTLDAILEKEAFWIFPHEKVPSYIQIKANQHSRWLKGMQRIRQRLRLQGGNNSKIQSKLWDTPNDSQRSGRRDHDVVQRAGTFFLNWSEYWLRFGICSTRYMVTATF